MFQFNTKNFAETRLVRDADRKAATFVVESAATFPPAPFRATINREVVEVRRKSGNQLLDIRRGVEDTQARTHEAGSSIVATWTDGMFNKLVDHLRALDKAQEAYHGPTGIPGRKGRETLWVRCTAIRFTKERFRQTKVQLQPFPMTLHSS